SPTAFSTCSAMITTPRTTPPPCAGARRLPAGGREPGRREPRCGRRAVSRTGWELAVAALATAFAFIFSAWVNAVSRLSHARARRLQEERPRAGSVLVRLAANPRPYLAGTLLAMLLARVSAVVLVADVLQ